MNGQQMDPQMVAMMLRQQQQQPQGGQSSVSFGGGPQLQAPAQQQMGQMTPLQGGGGAPSMGSGMADAGGDLMDAYKQKMAADEQAAETGRLKLMIEALRGGIQPGVGPDGMGSTSFGGPR